MLLKNRSNDLQGAPDFRPRITLANRMVLGVATQVQAFVSELFQAPVHVLADDFPVESSSSETDVLIVGWCHIEDDLSETFGYDLVGPLALALAPSVIFYVIPSKFRPRSYRADLEMLSATSTQTPVLVLEVSKLNSTKLPELSALARSQISVTQLGQVRLLLPTLGEDDVLAEV